MNTSERFGDDWPDCCTAKALLRASHLVPICSRCSESFGPVPLGDTVAASCKICGRNTSCFLYPANSVATAAPPPSATDYHWPAPPDGYVVVQTESWRIEADGSRTLLNVEARHEPATDRETMERALRAEIASLNEQISRLHGQIEHRDGRASDTAAMARRMKRELEIAGF